MRSTSRFWVEDPKKYQNAVRYTGTDPRTLQLMEVFNTTIGLQKINSKAAIAALAGKQGMMVDRNYRGREVLSSYSPLKLNGLNWAILAEMEVGEAYRPLYKLQVILLIAGGDFPARNGVFGGSCGKDFYLSPASLDRECPET
jgi:hypothetical protein